MHYVDDHNHLRVEFQAKDFNVPQDELTAHAGVLAPLGEAVRDFSHSELGVKIVRHPRSQEYHVEARLKVPGRTLFSGDRDPYLDSAFQRRVRKLTLKAEEYARHPERDAVAAAARLTVLDRDVMLPEERDAGRLGEAFCAVITGYSASACPATRSGSARRRPLDPALPRGGSPHRRRAAYRRPGRGGVPQRLRALRRRPFEVPLNRWLDELIDPSVKMMLQHPDEEGENASLRGTLRACAGK